MFQTMNTILNWEKRLEIEEQKRKAHRLNDLVADSPAIPQPDRKEHKSIFARIFKLGKNRQPVYHGYTQENCRETQSS